MNFFEVCHEKIVEFYTWESLVIKLWREKKRILAVSTGTNAFCWTNITVMMGLALSSLDQGESSFRQGK